MKNKLKTLNCVALEDVLAGTSTDEDSHKQKLINKINNGGGWSDDVFARKELERYEDRQRQDDYSGSW